jgi:hypothetical protein
MKQGMQTFFSEAGEAACYALALVNVAEEYLGHEIDADAALLAGIDKGYIHYSWGNPDDNDNFFVGNPAGLLGDLTGRPWTVRKEAANYSPRPREFIIDRWERVKTGAVIGHFRRPQWDSLVNSVTVRCGTIVSLRVCAPA